jgi:4-aminobutyrate aminotransferase
MNSEAWLARDENVLASVLPRASNIVVSSGEGSWLYDVDRNRYLDFTSGIAVTNTGHCHPRVVEAIVEQTRKLLHTSVTTYHRLNILLAEKLATLTPFFDEPQVFFCNSGAEAVDGSLKLARKVTGRPGVIAFLGGFHGRTMAATALTTAKRKYREGYTPFPSHYTHAPYNTEIEYVERCVNNSGYRVGAMIVEPVLGEGGYIVPSASWLAGLRELCNQYGILLIFDEVQTGIGRTGHLWATETFGVTPDVLLFAKGIASGLPLGGIVAPRRIMDHWPTGTHGSTFGGNPVSCAAALATLDIVEPLLSRVREKGEEILERLDKSPFPVRGIGFMIGIELPGKIDADYVKSLCLNDGLLLLSCGPKENVIRLIPPLTISDVDLDTGVGIIEKHIKNI